MAPGTAPPLSTTVPVTVLLPAPCANALTARAKDRITKTDVALPRRCKASIIQPPSDVPSNNNRLSFVAWMLTQVPRDSHRRARRGRPRRLLPGRRLRLRPRAGLADE